MEYQLAVGRCRVYRFTEGLKAYAPRLQIPHNGQQVRQ